MPYASLAWIEEVKLEERESKEEKTPEKNILKKDKNNAQKALLNKRMNYGRPWKMYDQLYKDGKLARSTVSMVEDLDDRPWNPTIGREQDSKHRKNRQTQQTAER